MRRKAMAKGMAARRLHYLRLTNSTLDCPLHDLLVLMMSGRQSGIRISAERVCRKDPLPSPLSRRPRIFAGKRGRQRYARFTQLALPTEAIVQLGQMLTQGSDERVRQHGHPILTALGVSNDDFTALQDKVLDPKAMRLHPTPA